MSKSTSFALPAIIVIAIAGVVLWPLLIPVRHSTATLCLSNVKQQVVALVLYESDWDEHYPVKEWQTSLAKYTKARDFSCDEVTKKGGKDGYALDWHLLGADAKKIADPTRTAVVFETDALGRDVVANLAAVSVGRHKEGSNFGYADAHAKWKKRTLP
jgi:prepilin-type processing-associated H-X9-DG protein